MYVMNEGFLEAQGRMRESAKEIYVDGALALLCAAQKYHIACGGSTNVRGNCSCDDGSGGGAAFRANGTQAVIEGILRGRGISGTGKFRLDARGFTFDGFTTPITWIALSSIVIDTQFAQGATAQMPSLRIKMAISITQVPNAPPSTPSAIEMRFDCY